jgi:hypothetical protein
MTVTSVCPAGDAACEAVDEVARGARFPMSSREAQVMWALEAQAMWLMVRIRTDRTRLADGEFFCPGCGGDRRYRRGTGRRRLVVLGVPVATLGRAGSGVECAVCAVVHDVAVLDVPTGRRLTLLLRDATRAVVVEALAAGTATGSPTAPAARAAAVEAIRGAGSAAYDDAALASDLLSRDSGGAAAAMAALAPHLELAGRECLVALAAGVALADGPYDSGERAMLLAAGDQLGMTRARVDRVLEEIAGHTPR